MALDVLVSSHEEYLPTDEKSVSTHSLSIHLSNPLLHLELFIFPSSRVNCIWLENSRLNEAIDNEQRWQTNEGAKRTLYVSAQTLLVMQAGFHVALRSETIRSAVRCILRMTATTL